MRNHIHLLIQVSEIPLSKIIHNLSFRYTQKINRKNKKIGHLFQGRFKAILIEESEYFNRLLRYIHLNPVRANNVQNPKNYIWSSHNAYLGNDQIAWLTTDYGLSKFGKTVEEARAVYSLYASKVESPEELIELRRRFKDGQVLGENDFLDEIRKMNCIQLEKKLSLKSILKAVCSVLEIEEESIFSSNKARAASYARGVISSIAKKEKIPVEEIAKLMRRDGSIISSLISRFSCRYTKCPKTENLITKIIVKAKQIAELQA